MVYSTLDAKQTMLEEMFVKFPDFSKKSIERLIKEITVREKKEGDERVVYHATSECWNELTAE